MEVLMLDWEVGTDVAPEIKKRRAAREKKEVRRSRPRRNWEPLVESLKELPHLLVIVVTMLLVVLVLWVLAGMPSTQF